MCSGLVDVIKRQVWGGFLKWLIRRMLMVPLED